MKTTIIICAIIATFIGCKVGRTTESRGLENQAYLQFVKGPNAHYNEGVEVFIDHAEPFVAIVDKLKKQKVRGHVYLINTGKRHLKVIYQGQVLYEKDILVSTQETKRIQLP